MNDYLKCARLYFLRNVYKDPKTGHKVTIMKPALALGQAVHDVIESLSSLPVEERLKESLFDKLDSSWQKITGKLGGFKDQNEENLYKDRARAMVQRIMDNPGPILKKAVKIKMDLPHYWLSEDDGIILCGKIDWLEYIEETDSVKIIDFKTGKHEEDSNSLQLPIYSLLLKNCQTRDCIGAGYWYLGREGELVDVDLPDIDASFKRVYEIAKKVALARKLDHFKCTTPGGCVHCQPLETVVKGGGELVGVSEYNQDIYVI